MEPGHDALPLHLSALPLLVSTHLTASQLPHRTASAMPAQHTDTRNSEQSFAILSPQFYFPLLVHVIALVCDVHQSGQSLAQQMTVKELCMRLWTCNVC